MYGRGDFHCTPVLALKYDSFGREVERTEMVEFSKRHQNILFSTGYSTRWFAKFMQAAAVKDPVISLILAGMHFIAIFICFGSAAILDSLPPREDGDIIRLQQPLSDPVYVSRVGLPIAYSRSAHISNTASGPDNPVETVQATVPVSGGES
ncbi:hypothetical protein BDQ17DRAFT_1344581 [Cyathus striatus]|nr:hypothetical protein BDQ17DRAFT_1344581 [Cyathus striatus]